MMKIELLHNRQHLADSSDKMELKLRCQRKLEANKPHDNNCYNRSASMTFKRGRQTLAAESAKLRGLKVLVVLGEHDKLRRKNKFNYNQSIGQNRTVLGSCSWLLLLVVTLFSSVMLFQLSMNVEQKLGNCAKLADIYWNSSNPIFRIDNTDHIFDVNKKQNDQDQVDLVCPSTHPAPASSGSSNADPNAANRSRSEQERYIIYSVSKEEYDTCRLNEPKGTVVAVCDQPPNGKSRPPPFTVTFRKFTPQPNGLEFKPGQDYYFITALLGPQYLSDPARRFSPCRELNMKVIFKVCCQPLVQPAPEPSTSAGPALIRDRGAGASTTSRSVPQLVASTTRAPLRRPAVVTIRPTLAAKQVAPSPTGSLDEILRNLNNQAAQPQPLQHAQQPITVLPIEVLQPSSAEPSTSGPIAAQPEPQPGPSQAERDAERNDILLNEQQPRPPAPSAHLERPSLSALRQFERYAPTPLPQNLLRAAGPAQRQFPPSQPSGGEHAAPLMQLPAYPRHPHPMQVNPGYPLQPISERPQPNQRIGHHSRITLYPYWSTAAYDQRMEQQQTPRDLITVQDSQTSAANRLMLTPIGFMSYAWLALLLLLGSQLAARGPMLS